MNQLLKMFEDLYGPVSPVAEPLKGSASSRKYYRLSSAEASCIGVVGNDELENKAFLYLDRHFESSGLPVPHVLSVSGDSMRYLQEDLGDTSLFDLLSASRSRNEYSAEDIRLLEDTVRMLTGFQFEAAKGLDYSVCYPEPSFGPRMVSFDLNYFKYCFLKPSGVDFNEISLQDDFDRLSSDLMKYDSDTFMYRDFQSRNVMVKDGRPYFIDFQGGRRGPFHYDLASFVNQSRAAYPAELKEHLVNVYYDSLKKYVTLSRADFDRGYALFSLFRCLQTLGAYGFRGLVQHKENFISVIPAAIADLSGLLEDDVFNNYPYLRSVLCRMCSMERFRKPEMPQDCPLVIEVLSFSFRKGIPEDPSGNGGGFVFDCRGMHNPGRYDQYKSMTGKDRPVIDFLEEIGEVQRFMDNVYGMVDPHIETFIKRGLTHMMVCFGCTGGQHRSVYGAEHFAAHVRAKYPSVKLILKHREQDS